MKNITMTWFFLTYSFFIVTSDQKEQLSPLGRVLSIESRNSPRRIDHDVFPKSTAINTKPTSQISPDNNASSRFTTPYKRQTSNQ